MHNKISIEGNSASSYTAKFPSETLYVSHVWIYCDSKENKFRTSNDPKELYYHCKLFYLLIFLSLLLSSYVSFMCLYLCIYFFTHNSAQSIAASSNNK